jgi:hypothetical protein
MKHVLTPDCVPETLIVALTVRGLVVFRAEASATGTVRTTSEARPMRALLPRLRLMSSLRSLLSPIYPAKLSAGIPDTAGRQAKSPPADRWDRSSSSERLVEAVVM